MGLCLCADECVDGFEIDTDRPGGDIQGIPNGPDIPKSKPEFCCKACRETVGEGTSFSSISKGALNSLDVSKSTRCIAANNKDFHLSL